MMPTIPLNQVMRFVTLYILFYLVFNLIAPYGTLRKKPIFCKFEGFILLKMDYSTPLLLG